MTPAPQATPAAPTPSLQLSPDLAFAALVTLLAVVVVLLITVALAGWARGASLRALRRTRAEPSTALLVGRTAYLAVVAVGLLTALGVLGVPWPTVLAVTGVVGLAASLALQDLLKNFVAGIYLLVERPFRIGDRVKVKEYTGRVETVEIRTTTLRTEEGEAVIVPNAVLFAEAFLNRGAAPAPQPGEEPARL